jgi:hypothetical protein
MYVWRFGDAYCLHNQGGDWSFESLMQRKVVSQLNEISGFHGEEYAVDIFGGILSPNFSRAGLIKLWNVYH